MRETTDRLPRAVDDISAEWLSHALSLGAGETITVSSVTQGHIVWGNATKVCLRAEHDRPDIVPLDLCVKGGFDERLSRDGSPAQLVVEVDFYGDLRQHLPSSALPASYYAGAAPDGSQGVIILEDLRARGVRFVDAGETLSVDAVASGLEAQARWHGATWGQGPGDLPHVRVGGLDRQAARYFLSEKYWTRHFAEEGSPVLPDSMSRERLMAANQALWAHDDVGTLSLQHGDAHAGNTYVEPLGRLVFLDWAAYFLGHWAHDVAYFIVGALDIETRRAMEEELVSTYLDALAGHGGPRMSLGAAWTDYARHHIRGLTWAVAPALMQPFERSRVMTQRHVAAAEDHDTFALLEGGA